jgi:hypothetical protein
MICIGYTRKFPTIGYSRMIARGGHCEIANRAKSEWLLAAWSVNVRRALDDVIVDSQNRAVGAGCARHRQVPFIFSDKR